VRSNSSTLLPLNPCTDKDDSPPKASPLDNSRQTPIWAYFTVTAKRRFSASKSAVRLES
jgi:hypothetical protein